MSVSFHIESSYLPVFRQNALDSFDALMNGAVGEMISNPADRRKLHRFSLPSAEGREVFYLKRMRNEPMVWLLKAFFAGRLPSSGPLREMQLLSSLRRNGFAVMTPVAWGEERRWGIPVAGFLVVGEIRGIDAAELFAACLGEQRSTLLRDVGALVGRLHAAGFFHPVRLKDLIREESSRQLVMIDRETSKPWPARFSRQRAVVALARTARRTFRDGHRFGPASTRSFLSGYVSGIAGQWPVSVSALRCAVIARLRRDLA